MWPFLAVGHVQKSGTKFLKIFFTHVPTSWGHVKKYGTKFLKLFCTHAPTSWGHVKKSGTAFLKTFCTHVPAGGRHVRNICPSYAKTICYFSACHWVVSQGSTSSAHNRGARAGAPHCCSVRRLSLGWLLKCKHKHSIYSWQRTGMYFWHVFN